VRIGTKSDPIHLCDVCGQLWWLRVKKGCAVVLSGIAAYAPDPKTWDFNPQTVVWLRAAIRSADYCRLLRLRLGVSYCHAMRLAAPITAPEISEEFS